MKRLRLPLLLCLVLAVASARPASRFIVLSDIHFNPLGNPALAPKLLASEPAQWESIFASDPHPPTQIYKDDSVWPLFSSLISQLKNLEPNPILIVVTGDVLAHKLREKLAASGSDSDSATYSTFVNKTVAFVGLQLQKAAAGAPVIYTLGNNDDECGDYALQPGGPFLKETAQTVQELSRLNASDMEKWLTLGSYVAPNPLAPHHRIIALNTTFWSRRYVNACGAESGPADPGASVMEWLSTQLEDARQHGDKVWLAYHIPPGIDGHSSAHAGQATPLWKPAYSEAFNKLLEQYGKTIELNLAGHTHLDDFRLMESARVRTLVLINPGVSPNIGQNPAFRVITVDSRARPVDLLTYFMPTLSAQKWQLEYSARPALSLKRIDFDSYQALYRRIGQSEEAMDNWKRYYAVSRPESLESGKAYLRSLYCATGHADPPGFEACLKQAATNPTGTAGRQ